ncbi:hypothetical protein [Pseudophaeobacter sp.]|uniref:hypothetical protein n=1 Tax=Pseudophaeobacter sp. TaxID=1971739 RepID=UPI003297A81F
MIPLRSLAVFSSLAVFRRRLFRYVPHADGVRGTPNADLLVFAALRDSACNDQYHKRPDPHIFHALHCSTLLWLDIFVYTNAATRAFRRWLCIFSIPGNIFLLQLQAGMHISTSPNAARA